MTCDKCHSCGEKNEAVELLREIRDALKPGQTVELVQSVETVTLPKRSPGRPKKGVK